MFTRSLSLFVAALAAVVVVATTAVAQTRSDAPAPVVPAPGTAPAPAPGTTAAPGAPGAPQAPGAQPGACVDQTAPVSRYTAKAARSAARNHVLRGTASDVGCGVDRVDVSVAKRTGKRCRFLAPNHRLARSASCSTPNWMPAKGTTTWTFRMPKKLAAGTYVVSTRATDFAGNAQQVRSHKLRLR
jgi:hypothetical protein